MQLGHVIEADCRWRLTACAGDADAAEQSSQLRTQLLPGKRRYRLLEYDPLRAGTPDG